MKNILIAARITIKMGLGITFVIFSLISAFFVFSSVLYFALPQLNRYNLEPAGVNAMAMGLSSMNIFLIFFSIFLSLSVLSRQFSRGNLLFILSKPFRPGELLLGSSLGLMFIFLLYWFFLCLEVLAIILIFDKTYLVFAIFAVLPVILLIPLYTSLCVFFFSLWPNYFSAIFPFLFIFTSFARLDIIALISQTNLVWLKKMIETSFFFIPPVGQIMASSLNALGLINVNLNMPSVALNSLFIVCFFHIIAAQRVGRTFSNL